MSRVLQGGDGLEPHGQVPQGWPTIQAGPWLLIRVTGAEGASAGLGPVQSVNSASLEELSSWFRPAVVRKTQVCPRGPWVVSGTSVVVTLGRSWHQGGGQGVLCPHSARMPPLGTASSNVSSAGQRPCINYSEKKLSPVPAHTGHGFRAGLALRWDSRSLFAGKLGCPQHQPPSAQTGILSILGALLVAHVGLRAGGPQKLPHVSARYRPCGPLVPKPWGDQRQSRLWDRVGPLSAGPRPAGLATLAVCERLPWVLLPWQGQEAGLVPVHVCFRGFCVCAAQGGPEGGCESWPIAGRGSGALLHPTACDRDPGSVSARPRTPGRPCPPGACAVGLHLPSSSQPVCSFVQMEYVT